MLRNRSTVSKLYAAGKHAVIFSGCHGIDRFLDSIIPGTACFRMVNGGFSLHAEPVRDLHIRCQIIGRCKRARLTMKIEIHVLRIYAGILHRFQSCVSIHFSLCQSIRFRIVHRVHERSTSNADDGYSSAVRMNRRLVHHNIHFPVLTFSLIASVFRTVSAVPFFRYTTSSSFLNHIHYIRDEI